MLVGSKNTSKMDYRLEVDGLRAVAVLPVILFHAGIRGFEGGFVGVDIFFVISGYLITRIILGEISTGSFSITKFYDRRLRRILPAYFVVVLATLIAGWFILLPSEYIGLGKSVVASTVFVANIYFWRTSDYFAPTAEELPLLHMWSLSVEEQFYVFFPLFVLFTWKLGPRVFLSSILGILVISFMTAELLAGWKDIANFFLAPTRAWELLVGCVIGYIHRNGVTLIPRAISEVGGLLGLSMISLAILLLDPSVPFPSWWAWLPVGGAGLFIAFARTGTLAARLLSWRPIVFIGLISYSTYLWHQPILVFGRFFLIDEPSILIKAALAALSIVIGAISWRFVERPFRNHSAISRRAIFGYGGGSMAGLCVAGLVLGYSNGFPARLPDKARYYASEIGEPQNILGECILELAVTPTPCRIGAGPPRYFIFGDSHVRAVAIAMDQVVNSSFGLGSEVATVSGCGPFPDFERVGKPMCSTNAKELVEYALSKDAPDTIILLSRWAMYSSGQQVDNGEGGVEYGSIVEMVPSSTIKNLGTREDNFIAAVQRLTEEILMAGKRVVIIGSVPEVGWQVPQRLARAELTGANIRRPISTEKNYYDERSAPLLSAIEPFRDNPQFLFLDPGPVFCEADRCAAEIGGEPLYFDDDHLNARGAKFMFEAFAPELNTFLESSQSQSETSR
jgi:peptidoglycan/LPS O-acetylase OafA/YrhL